MTSAGDSDSRGKMMRSAAALFASRGMNATSFSDVLADSGAPRGSIYHHFPDGKSQLTAETIAWVAARVADHQRGYTGTTATGVLERFIGMWRRVVEASKGASGCALAGVAVDTAVDEVRIMDVARAGFQSWIDLLTEQLAATGIAPDRARSIAIMTVSGLEGALILCRAEGNARPLETVAAELARLVSG